MQGAKSQDYENTGKSNFGLRMRGKVKKPNV